MRGRGRKGQRAVRARSRMRDEASARSAGPNDDL